MFHFLTCSAGADRPVSQNMRDLDHEVAPRGEGNVVSIEFNLLYRWHATVSEHDTKWTEEEFSRMFQGKDPATVSSLDSDFCSSF